MNDYWNHVDTVDDNCWGNLFDCSGLLDDALPPADIFWNPQPATQSADASFDALLSGTSSQACEFAEEKEFQRKSAGLPFDASFSGSTSQASDSAENRECRRKRGRTDKCGGTGTKACCERIRREKLNDRFCELSTVLGSGRPTKSDKLAILSDAIKILNELKTESQEYSEMNEKLSEEIKTLKAEKNELREEKLVLKMDKEKIEQQLKAMVAPLPPTNFMAGHLTLYPAGAQKMPMFPSYGLVPMWPYLPPSARDTSQDHELRPPAA